MADIDELRNRMDEVTLQMMRLLKDRTEIAREIGNVKKITGRSVTDEARENSLREKTVRLGQEIGLDEEIATRFLNFLLNESVKIQASDKQTHLSVFLKAKEMELQGSEIIHMEVGEPDFLPPAIARDALGEVYDAGFLKYGQASGMPAFRDALASYANRKFGANISQENVVVSPGARFSVFAAITTLLNPGDEMIVIEPAWPAYKDCALNSGVKVRAISTSLEDGWEPSVQQIRDAINCNTGMIVLNYPNNPTGKILPERLQDQIIGIARENGLYVLSDEIYSDYASPSWKSVLRYGYERSIVTQSFSKSHAMTGFRIGYAIADAAIIRRMARLQSLCLTNVAEPIQYVAMKALEADTSKNNKTIQDRLDVLVQMAAEMGLETRAPDGAMYVFARINRDGFDGVRFAGRMLEKGLAVAPGEGFGDYKDFIRISACLDEKTLIKGMNILKESMEEA